MTDKIKKPLIALIIIFVAVVAADQITKQWAYHKLMSDTFVETTSDYPVCTDDDNQTRSRRRFLRNNRETMVVIDGNFDFRYVENCASAFGIMESMPEKFRFPFFLIISLLACGFIPYLWWKTPPEHKLMLWALPFVLGGAIGNLIDRMIYRFVIDFIDWYLYLGGIDRHWPTFNIADVAIVIGIILMFWQMLPTKNTSVNMTDKPKPEATPSSTN